ncbi:MAG: benzoate/H(+) symporter BenE family transporter [Pseudomonadales bacterium]
MMSQLKFSHISAGFIAVLVGYTSSVSIIFQAAQSLGASQAQLNSWMLVLGVGMGLSSFTLSLYYRIPVITAWSTPGAALLVTSLAGVPMSEAIASFIFCGILITLCGLSGLFEHLQRYIPNALASAMLAGILFQFGIAIIGAFDNQPLLVSAMALSYLILKPIVKNYTIPLVLLVGIASCISLGLFAHADIELALPQAVWVTPEFNINSLISVAIPLFIVTMTSQNIPGLATIQAAGYQISPSGPLTLTGITTTLLAPFGGFSYNLAAITAAICCSKDADSDRNTRYLAGLTTGVFYLLVGLAGTAIVSLFAAAPSALVITIAGLALLPTLGHSLSNALCDEGERDAALVTFLITVSGLEMLTIGAAFWGLVGGLLTLMIQRGLK